MVRAGGSPPLRIAVCVRVITGLRPAGSEAREACVPYLCPEGERRSGEEG